MIQINIVVKQEEARDLIMDEFEEVELITCDQRAIIFETPNDQEYLDKIKSFLKGRKEMMAIYFSVAIKR